MDKSELLAKLDDTIEFLEKAQSLSSPYVLEINGIKTILSREQCLDFSIDIAIEDLYELKESINEDDAS
ncbi:hypothetical protein [Paenibacillus larvae]|uniref:hypothetical protein n=1 Tax=Paenibacillus larvae TaxID=1464 RepID=UPI002890F5A8|nr:hypothetical protein [Paenibacillus larvae]MDT2173449.1 hypothetical protein [Paenibacillus larvae]MDT2246008.1 hypothetical protein [Paenibacillus larvae]MDT2259607.1 hypothetical protein [Paenibacillus larvae]MDT2275119.1 hypothetical protein [Paenibacillus larvae]